MRWIGQPVELAIAAALTTFSVHAATTLPEGEGKVLTMRVCNNCHAIDVVVKHRLPKAVWSSVVDKMAAAGATATDHEFDVITEYLAKNFGEPESADSRSHAPAVRLNVNDASAGQLEKVLGLSGSEATAVVQYRKRRGRYKDLQGLKKVPGLDAAKIEVNKDRIVFY